MTQSPFITNVDQATFTRDVMDRSRQVPVLVDFWAPWCAPCRMLAPVLDRLVEAYAGRLLVAKVNTDDEQALAREYSIRGIPALKLFRHGRVVGELVGVQPESAIRELVDRFVPTEADERIERAGALVQADKVSDAIALLREALALDPTNDGAKLALARTLYLNPNDNDGAAAHLAECTKLLDSLSLKAAAEPKAETLRTQIDLRHAVVGAPPIDALRQAVAANPNDHAARFRLGAQLALADDYEAAMENFLELVRRDRGFGDDAARKTLVGIFNLLGNQHPLVAKYRGLLSRALN